MNTEKVTIGQNPPQAIVVMPGVVTLPFNVASDLNQYSRIFITHEYDYFRVVHNYENAMRDYKIFGETPDGDKKLLFTAHKHFECKVCEVCDQCIISTIICDYVCCDQIIFQMDYRRNGAPFYTQGYNLQKGLYCCKCYCCTACCVCCACCACCDCCAQTVNTLFLRENIDPESRDFNVGTHKGTTNVVTSCCATDYISFFAGVDGAKGPTVRAKCCDICKHNCAAGCCCCNADFEMDIEDETGLKTGSVMIYSGNYSQKSEGRCCYRPRPYFEVNMPPNASSEQKFQIIADLIHFNIKNSVI